MPEQTPLRAGKAQGKRGKKGKGKKKFKGLRKDIKRAKRMTRMLERQFGGGGGGGRGGGTSTSTETVRASRERGGGGGGGEGGAGRYGPDAEERELQSTLQEQVAADVGAEPLEFEDEFGDELTRIREKAGELESGDLPTLGEETATELDELRAAEEGQLDMRRKLEQENLLLKLYGSGATQSTVAGEAAGRMLYGQEQTHLQIMANDASRRLQARADMADRIMSSLSFQAQVASGQQQTALQAFGMEVQQVESAKQRHANMLDAMLGRRTSERLSREQNRTAVKTANIQAGAVKYSADRSKEAAIGAASIGARASMMNSVLDYSLGKRQLKSQKQQFQADLGFRNKSLQYQDTWQQEGFDLQRAQQAQQARQHKDAISAQKQAMWLSFAGGLLSDVRFKEDVTVITDAISRVKMLHGHTWKWMGSPDAPDAGVIAQQVQVALPEAVEETEEGYLLVKPMAILGLLVEAVNELIERQENGVH
jgi:hypothetical protein